MIEKLLTDWNFILYVRLVLGIFVDIQAVESKDRLLGLIATFFLFQVATNTECCATKNSCKISTKKEIELTSKNKIERN